MRRKRLAAVMACALAAVLLLSGCSASSGARIKQALLNPPEDAGELEVMQMLNATTDGDYRSLGGEAMSGLAGFVVFDEPWSPADDGVVASDGDEADDDTAADDEVEASEDDEAGDETSDFIGGYPFAVDYVRNFRDPEVYGEDISDDERAGEDFAALEKLTDAPRSILEALIYLKLYCQNNEASDALDTLASYLHDDGMSATRREAFESLYLRMLVGSLGYNDAYADGLSSFESVYNDYIDIGVKGFEKRAFAELQNCPDRDVAVEFLEFLLDNNRADEITPDLLLSTAKNMSNKDSVFDVYRFLESADMACFGASGNAALFDEALAKLESEGLKGRYDAECKSISQVVDFARSREKLFTYITDEHDYSSASSYYSFTVVAKDLYSNKLMDKIYVPNSGEPKLPTIEWTNDMLVDYYGSSSFTPSDPQPCKILLVQNSEDSDGMDYAFDQFSYGEGLEPETDPDLASAAIYYSVTYPFDSYYRFETGEIIPAYSCYVRITAVDLRTGGTIGSLTYSSIPPSQVSVYSVPDEWYEELPDFDYDELSALAKKVYDAISDDTSEGGL